MSNKKALDVESIIERVKECVGVKTNLELSDLLGIKQNTVSAWKKRGNIDLASIITLCEPTGVSMDWLLYGKGGRCEGPSKGIDPTDKIMEMLETMTEEEKRDVLKYVEKEKFWKELMESRKIA